MADTKKKNLKVALLQLIPGSTPVESFEIAKSAIEKAAKNNANIVVLPELWNIGYRSPEEYSSGFDEWKSFALNQDDKNFKIYSQLAKDLSVAILFPYLEIEGTEFYNSASLINRNGEIVLNYRKVHTVDKGWEKIFTSGNDFPVADLELDGDIVKVGCMICYDREFPEASRILMLNGAEVVLVPNACNLDLNRLCQFQARGFENMFGVAMTNYPAPKFNGRSVAYNGLRIKGENDYNPCLVLGDDSENIFYADFDIDTLREYRKSEIWGDAYRKPRLYKKLSEDNPQEPFLRKDARR